MIESSHAAISIRRQCDLIGLNRSTLYYRPAGESPFNLELMRLIDEQYTKTPFYEWPRMTAHLHRLGYEVNHKRVQRLMQQMGLQTVYPKPQTTLADKEHKIYPYLLRDLEICCSKHVWAADITYIRMHQGFMYLVAVMDWFSRYVIAWELSNTLDGLFCLQALERALEQGQPEIFNTDQGVNSLRWPSRSHWKAPEYALAWMVVAEPRITSLWNDYGGASNMRTSTSERLREDYLDMVVASRPRRKEVAYRQGHSLGNALLTSVVSFLFGRKLKDMLSGYRVFSRRFVKSFPSLASGFEIETELTVHTLELRLPFEEVEVEHRERPIGSFSKLRTVRDGLRICWTILVLVKEIRPLLLFGSTAGLLALSSVALSIPLFATYLETGLVPRFPTAILCTGLMLLAFLNAGSGIVLSSMSRSRREVKRMFYLAASDPLKEPE
jgi:hypothetical protein